MRATFSKAEFESELSSRFASAFRQHEKRPVEVISTGIPQIDLLTIGGLPRGAIAEVFGPASSGRTSFMFSALAQATKQQEVCALVDTNNAFDPESASQAEINFDRLLWIRCANNLEHAFKATDLLMQGGGFGLVILDLGDIPAKEAKRIISSWWYRFRRTLETTPTTLVVIAEESCVRSCAALALELKNESGLWSSTRAKLEVAPDNIRPLIQPSSPRVPAAKKTQALPTHSNIFQGLQYQVECQRPLYLHKREDKIFCNANC